MLTDSQKLAVLLILSANARVSSYDKAAAQAAGDAYNAEFESAKANGSPMWLSVGPDYNSFYSLTLEAAVEQECAARKQTEMARPVFLLLANSWNDALYWAETNWPDSEPFPESWINCSKT